MPLDLKRLASDAKTSRKKRMAEEASGLHAAIRQALPEIERLRADGIRWREIAEALAGQGVVQGTGEAKKPLTASRLTAVIDKLQKAKRRRAEKSEARSKRSDLSEQRPGSGHSIKIGASNEPIGQTAGAIMQSDAVHEDAECLRRERLAKVRGFTKDNQ